MKKYIYTLVLLFSTSLVFWTCKESETYETLEVNTDSLNFDEHEGSQYISITSQAKWSIEINENSWLEANPTQGRENERIQITVKANNTDESRTGFVTIKTVGGITQSITVIQGTEEPYITIQPVSATALSEGDEITIRVSGNKEWLLDIPEKDEVWISLKSQTATEAILNIEANNTDNDRSSLIAFQLKDWDKKANFELSQKKKAAEPVIEINPKEAEIRANGSDITVNVESGIAWEVKIPESDTWISIKEKTSNSVIFQIAENFTGEERASKIIFQSKDENIQTIFSIAQAKDYKLMTSLNPTSSQAGANFSALNTYVRQSGFDYTEHPGGCSGGYGAHTNVDHLFVEKDPVLDKYVFRFDIHIDPVIDGNLCSSSSTDRQRNEMKTVTNNSTWAKVQGNWNEWQIIEFKFKIPSGFQPTHNFCHLYQLKAQDGPYNGTPIITITPRASNNGSNRRMQVIHSVVGAETGKGNIVDGIPLSYFEDEWIQVRQEIYYDYKGHYSCKMTRIRDGRVLVNYTDDNIDMWRKGSSYIRTKYGIYRSLAGGDLSKNPVGQSPLLKNESVWMCDF